MNYAILSMPNKFNALILEYGLFLFYRIGVSFFRVVHVFEFGKNANSNYVDETRTAYKLVWRQSEFAFFVR